MQDQKLSLDELVREHYQVKEQGAPQGNGKFSTRAEIIDFVNSKGNQDETIRNSEQTDPGSLEPATDPDSPEAGIDNVLNREAPGTVPGAGDKPAHQPIDEQGGKDPSTDTDTGKESSTSNGTDSNQPADQAESQVSTQEESSGKESSQSSEQSTGQEGGEENSQKDDEVGDNQLDEIETDLDDVNLDEVEDKSASELTDEEIVEEAEKAQQAAQEVAEVGNVPDQAPNEQEAVESEKADATQDNQVLSPDIDKDEVDEVLDVKSETKVLDEKEGLREDIDVIKKAYELDNRLGEYARIIVDKFPASGDKEQVGKLDKQFVEVSQLALESMTEVGKELVGQDYDPEYDDVVQEAVILAKSRALSVLDSTGADLKLVLEKAEKVLCDIPSIINSRVVEDKKASGSQAMEIFLALASNNKLIASDLSFSTKLSGIANDIYAWIDTQYSKLLIDLENGNTGSVGPLVLNSLPSIAGEGIKFNDAIVTRHSDVLPGEVFFIQVKSGDDLDVQMVTEDIDENQELPSFITVPGQTSLRHLTAELTNVFSLSKAYKERLSKLFTSLDAFYTWYENASPITVEIKQAHNIFTALEFASSFGAYLTVYLKHLMAYTLIEGDN